MGGGGFNAQTFEVSDYLLHAIMYTLMSFIVMLVKWLKFLPKYGFFPDLFRCLILDGIYEVQNAC